MKQDNHNSYQDTLNLPSTRFPMKASLAAKEPNIIKNWEEINLYHELKKTRRNQSLWILHDGPPYANGALHLGHAVNKILKDIIVKSKVMAGFNADYVPGWDCHGLPIEINVEKKHGKVHQKLSLKEFRQKCRDYAENQINLQKEEFKRFGILGDWDNPYKTLNFSYEANEVRSLAAIYKAGHVVRGEKPVYWSIGAHSALAEAEIEYQDKVSQSLYVKLNFVDSDALAKKLNLNLNPITNLSVCIWTTTAWTLVANEAVALNPELAYSFVQYSLNDKLEVSLLATGLIETVMNKWSVTDYKTLAEIDATELELMKLKHPFYDKEVPIIFGEHVADDAGTGCVHTAPAHGPEDFAVGKKYNLPVNNPVGPNGNYLSFVEIFANENVLKVYDRVLEVLQEKGSFIFAENITHSYPHCWRTKTPLIYRTTPQWFISMEKEGLRKKALAAIKTVKWIPETGEDRITSMIADRPDWCISRQRYWGVPICILINKETQEPHPKTHEIMLKVADSIEAQGIDAWDNFAIADLVGADEVDNYDKVTDILDVWFDSGTSYKSVLQDPARELTFPADMYLEGSDQHRGWFHSSLLTSCAINGAAPYKEVVTHGFTVDGEGRKMSKSLGNGMLPKDIYNKYGADILRLWIASSDYRYEISFSDEILNRITDAYRKIRNTLRFLLANLNDFDIEQHNLAPSDMVAIDAWIINKTACLQDEIKKDYENYRLQTAVKKIQNFCVIELGSFYLDVIKDRQYTCQKNSPQRLSAQFAIYQILATFNAWIAPILSFTAEEVYDYIPKPNKKNSIFFEEFYELKTFKINKLDLYIFDDLMSIKDEVNKLIEIARDRGEIGTSLSAKAVFYLDDAMLAKMKPLKNELKFAMLTSYVDLKPLGEAPNDATISKIDGLKLKVIASDNKKCARCWHYVKDVGLDTNHPDICARCVSNVVGTGEQREFI